MVKPIQFTCANDTYLGGYHIRQGDMVNIYKIGEGLYALSGSDQGDNIFAMVTIDTINKLQGQPDWLPGGTHSDRPAIFVRIQ